MNQVRRKCAIARIYDVCKSVVTGMVAEQIGSLGAKGISKNIDKLTGFFRLISINF